MRGRKDILAFSGYRKITEDARIFFTTHTACRSSGRLRCPGSKPVTPPLGVNFSPRTPSLSSIRRTPCFWRGGRSSRGQSVRLSGPPPDTRSAQVEMMWKNAPRSSPPGTCPRGGGSVNFPVGMGAPGHFFAPPTPNRGGRALGAAIFAATSNSQPRRVHGVMRNNEGTHSNDPGRCTSQRPGFLFLNIFYDPQNKRKENTGLI